jgi:hypothetical protein
MKLMTGHALAGTGVDVDATATAHLLAGTPWHAVREGSPVTVCGAPVGEITDSGWPPEGSRCDLCDQIVASFGS